MKTVVVDCRMLRASGIGTYLQNVLSRLLRNTSYNFILLGEVSEISEWLRERKLKASIVSCEAPIYGIREQWQLWRAIPRECDLYWTPHYDIPLLYQGKMLVTVQDLCHLAKREFLPGTIPRAYARFMFEMVARKATRIVTGSEFSKHELLRYTSADVSKIHVIHYGCPDIDKYDDGKAPVTNSYILYVGNVKPNKNLRRIVEAHSRIFPLIQKPLVIVGKKSGFITEDRALAKFLVNLPQNQLHFTGYISNHELATYYRKASMLVFASLYEGFGFPPLEAMSCGVPVVASHEASLPEVCGKAALYCNPYSVDDIAEKMLLVNTDNNIREYLIKEGWERIRLFSWDESAQKHSRLIKEILG